MASDLGRPANGCPHATFRGLMTSPATAASARTFRAVTSAAGGDKILQAGGPGFRPMDRNGRRALRSGNNAAGTPPPSHTGHPPAPYPGGAVDA